MSALTDHIERLFEFLERVGQLPPLSHDVRITEKYPPTTELKSVAEYEARFDEIMRAGHRWVNLHYSGIHNGFLVLTVTEPGYPGRPEWYLNKTSVNLSGASHIDLAGTWKVPNAQP